VWAMTVSIVYTPTIPHHIPLHYHTHNTWNTVHLSVCLGAQHQVVLLSVKCLCIKFNSICLLNWLSFPFISVFICFYLFICLPFYGCASHFASICMCLLFQCPKYLFLNYMYLENNKVA
jgi:hypothetical protein